MAKINIKDLANKIKESNHTEEVLSNKEVELEAIDRTNDINVVEPVRNVIEDNKQRELVKEVPEAPKKEVKAPVVVKNPVLVKVPEEQQEVKPVSEFNLENVINWKRPETVGKKKLVELHKEYDTFFAKVKTTTGVSTVKFVNFLVRDFLLKNPDFVRFINEESGKSPQLE